MTAKFFDDADSIPITIAAPKKSFFDDADSKPIDLPVLGDSSHVGFGSYVTNQIPIVGSVANAIGSGGAALAKKTMGDKRGIADIFKDEKAQYEADIAAYQKDKPGLGIAGTVLGGAALPLPPGASLAGQVATNAAVSAADAGLKGENIGGAAALGGGITAAFGGLGRAANAMPSLRDYAARRAVKAAGAMTKDMRALENKGMIESTGRELLDQGIVKFGSSLDDIAESAGKAKETAGKAIGAAIETADGYVTKARDFLSKSEFFQKAPKEVQDGLVNSLAERFGFNSQKIGKRLTDELVTPNAGNPMLAGEVKKLEKLAEQFGESAPKSLKEGLGIKSSQRRLTNFDSETVPQGFKKDVYKIVKEELQNGVGQSAKLDASLKNLTPDEFVDSLMFQSIDNPNVLKATSSEASDAFNKANKQYAIMANTEDMAKNRIGAAQSNREMSPSDYATAGLGMIQGGPVGAIALGTANKAMRRWGSSTSAVAANETAKILEAMPGFVKSGASAVKNVFSENANAAKGATNTIRDSMRPQPNMPDFAGHDKVQQIAKTQPEALGKYGPTLKAAVDRGGNSFAVTHFLLQQKDPAYREMIRTLDNH